MYSPRSEHDDTYHLTFAADGLSALLWLLPAIATVAVGGAITLSAVAAVPLQWLVQAVERGVRRRFDNPPVWG